MKHRLPSGNLKAIQVVRAYLKAKTERGRRLALERANKYTAKVLCYTLQQKLASLNEVLAPFVLHGKALGALKRKDVATTVSKIRSSYLCIGAFKYLMEEVDPVEFGLQEAK